MQKIYLNVLKDDSIDSVRVRAYEGKFKAFSFVGAIYIISADGETAFRSCFRLYEFKKGT